jgi:hypothetical protein
MTAYSIYSQLYSISVECFLHLQLGGSSLWWRGTNLTQASLGTLLKQLESWITFLFFRAQMESILLVEQLMALSTFLMFLLENWSTPLKVSSIGLWQWCINITITILDIIHCPVFCLKHNNSETRVCLHLQVEHTWLVPIDRASLCLWINNFILGPTE